MRMSEIISLLPSSYTQYSNYVATKCVFHDDSNPSMMIYQDGFSCMSASCGRSGSLSTLYNKLTGQRAKVQGHKRKSEWKDMGLPRVRDIEEFLFDANANAVVWGMDWYWKSRGLSESNIASFMLGHVDGWNTIPISNWDYNTVGYILRASPHIQELYDVRYIIPSGQRPMMYVPDWTLYRNFDYIIVVYGMIDAMVLNALGYPAVTTSGNGHKTFRPEWFIDKRVPKIVIPDKGEEASALNLARDIGIWGDVAILDFEDGKDCADLFITNKSYLKKQINNKLSELSIDGGQNESVE